MATQKGTNIGTVEKTEDGFSGSLETLFFRGEITAHPVKPEDRKSDNSPDYVVFHNGVQIGTMKNVQKRHSSGTYLSMRINHFQIKGGQNVDDIYINLAAMKDKKDAFWLLA